MAVRCTIKVVEVDTMALNLLDLPVGQDGEDDDEGEFCPCAFSDDEEEDHGIDCNCPLCKHGDGGTGDAHEIISRMEEIDTALTGNIRDDDIYRLQAEMFTEHVQKPLEKQGLEAPTITPEMCRDHFSKHRVNAKRVIAGEIRFVDTMQYHFRKQNILSRNNQTGETRINTSAVKQWIQLSKHKMDLIKYYKGPLSKVTGGNTKSMTPYSFS
jgi:hypothetical protein